MKGRSPSGRTTQARALRTREKLLRAAAAVFDRQGYSATNLEEISREAETTKGALYFHFRSKADLAKAVADAHREQCLRLAEQASEWGLPGLEAMERFFAELALSYQSDPITRAGVRLGNEYHQIGADLPMPFVDCVQRVKALIKSGQADGTIALSADPTSTARVMVGSFFGIQDMSARLTEGEDLVERTYEWCSFIRPRLVP